MSRDPDRPRRILAVDFGDRRTGLAATDYTGAVSLPLGKLESLSDRACADRIAALARERDTQLIVLGMPLLRDGGAGARASRTEAFRKILADVAPCPIAIVDESLTTEEAHERLKESGLKASRRKKLADSVAALVILERYLTTGAS